MKTIALFLSLVPSVALAHPGHGHSARTPHAVNDVLVIALVVAATFAIYRVTQMVKAVRK